MEKVMNLPKCERDPTLRHLAGTDATLESNIVRRLGYKTEFRYTVWQQGRNMGTIHKDGRHYWIKPRGYNTTDHNPLIERTLLNAARTLLELAS
jgi:hypothetical protein